MCSDLLIHAKSIRRQTASFDRREQRIQRLRGESPAFIRKTKVMFDDEPMMLEPELLLCGKRDQTILRKENQAPWLTLVGNEIVFAT